MLLPIGDDNRDRHLTPVVNYLLIISNILVFVFLQDLGSNLDFTFSYSAVPGEILTGHDIVTDAKYYVNPYTGKGKYNPAWALLPYRSILPLSVQCLCMEVWRI